MRLLLFLLCLLCDAAAAASQAIPHPRPYLFRIAHESFANYSCALLQNTGVFHLEFADGSNVRVFEGKLESDELSRIVQVLNDPELAALSQRQIEDALLSSARERLQLTIYRRDHSQDLFFQSAESEQPYRRVLNPLVRWLEDLRKRPHKEFSEDEGKQNCLPQTRIVLKKRAPNPPPSPAFAPPNSGPRLVLKPPPITPASLPGPSAAPLLRVFSFSMNGGDARQFCVLIADDGPYRFEDHMQKAGKALHTRIIAGKLDAEELAQLRAILDKPSLARIRHREPRRDLVPVMGDILNLSILRPQGEQKIMLTSSFGYEFGTFYGGDEHIKAAGDLTRFLRKYVEKNHAHVLDKSSRNNCTALQ